MNMLELMQHPERMDIAAAIIADEGIDDINTMILMTEEAATPEEIFYGWINSGKPQLRIHCENEAEYRSALLDLDACKRAYLEDHRYEDMQLASNLSDYAIYLRRKM